MRTARMDVERAALLPRHSHNDRHADGKLGYNGDITPRETPSGRRSRTAAALAWLRSLRQYVGPGFVVAVGYVDPGNWATGLEAGAKYKYRLLWVILLANVMAMLLQHLAVRLGVYGDVDLAAATRSRLKSAWLWLPMWLFTEVAIAACDLAEVIGAAIALKLLFGVPVVAGIVITTLDVLVLLTGLGSRSHRTLELLIIALVAVVGGCFAVEVVLARPDAGAVLRGTLLPNVPQLLRDDRALFISLGIIGATVMPHNLYLHSSLVRHRASGVNVEKAHASSFATWDSCIALSLAFLVNASILVTAAAGLQATRTVASLEDASRLLSSALGRAAGWLFALALLASGQSSTITGTLAGQVVFEGFVRLPLAMWKRQLLTRAVAVVPAIGVVYYYGAAAVNDLLLWSQAVLSLQLPFAIVSLVVLTSDESIVGAGHTTPRTLAALCWLCAAVLTALNGWMLIMQFVLGIDVL